MKYAVISICDNVWLVETNDLEEARRQRAIIAKEGMKTVLVQILESDEDDGIDIFDDIGNE